MIRSRNLSSCFFNSIIKSTFRQAGFVRTKQKIPAGRAGLFVESSNTLKCCSWQARIVLLASLLQKGVLFFFLFFFNKWPRNACYFDFKITFVQCVGTRSKYSRSHKHWPIPVLSHECWTKLQFWQKELLGFFINFIFKRMYW